MTSLAVTEGRVGELSAGANQEFIQGVRALMNQTIVGIARCELDGRVTFANRTLCQMLGYTAQELIGKTTRELTYPDDMAETTARFQQLLSTGQHYQIEKRYLRKDGSTLWANVNASLICDQAGSPLFVAAILIDISERKRAEIALRESEEQLRRATEAAQMFLCDIDLAAKTIRYSANSARLFGFDDVPPDYLDFEQLSLRIHPDDRQRVIAELLQTLKEPRTFALEYRAQAAQGYVWLLTHFSPHQAEDGSTSRIIGIGQNITERKQAEETLRQAEERLRMAVQAGSVGLWDMDLNTNRVFYSPEWKQQIGYAADEIGDDFMEWQSRVHPDDLEHVLQLGRAHLAGHLSNFDVEFRLRHKDGSYRWILARAALVLDQAGQPCRVLGSHVDINERKAVEQARHAAEEHMRLAMEAADMFSWELDYAARTARFSANTASVLGYELPEDLDQAIDYTHPDDKALVQEALQKASQSIGGKFEFENRSLDRDGVIDWTRSSGLFVTSERIIGITQNITKRKEAEALMRAAQEKLQAEQTRMQTLNRVVNAQEEERRRISRELHDQMGQRLTAFQLNLKTLKESAREQPQLCEQLSRLEVLAAQFNDDLDYITWQLRPAELEPGLPAALAAFVREWSRYTKVPAEYHTANCPGSCTPETEANLFRIVQEALNNVSKHARATRVDVILEARETDVILIVEDDGQGFDVKAQTAAGASGQQFGLISMRERAALCGGTLEIESKPGAGTALFVRVPLHVPEGAA